MSLDQENITERLAICDSAGPSCTLTLTEIKRVVEFGLASVRQGLENAAATPANERHYVQMMVSIGAAMSLSLYGRVGTLRDRTRQYVKGSVPSLEEQLRYIVEYCLFADGEASPAVLEERLSGLDMQLQTEIELFQQETSIRTPISPSWIWAANNSKSSHESSETVTKKISFKGQLNPLHKNAELVSSLSKRSGGIISNPRLPSFGEESFEETTVEYDSDSSCLAAPNDELQKTLKANNALKQTQALDGIFVDLQFADLPKPYEVVEEITDHCKSMQSGILEIIQRLERKPSRIADDATKKRITMGSKFLGKIASIVHGFVWAIENVDVPIKTKIMETALDQLSERASDLTKLFETFVCEYDAFLVYLRSPPEYPEMNLERPLFGIIGFLELLVLLVKSIRANHDEEPSGLRPVIGDLVKLGNRQPLSDLLCRIRSRYTCLFRITASKTHSSSFRSKSFLTYVAQDDRRLLRIGKVRLARFFTKFWKWYTKPSSLFLFDDVLIWTALDKPEKIYGGLQLFCDLQVSIQGRRSKTLQISSPPWSNNSFTSVRFICSNKAQSILWMMHIQRTAAIRTPSPSSFVCTPSFSVQGPFDRHHNFRVGVDLVWSGKLDDIVRLVRPIGSGCFGPASLCIFKATHAVWAVETVKAVNMQTLKRVLRPFVNLMDSAVESLFGIGGPDRNDNFWILKEYVEGGSLAKLAELQPPDMRQSALIARGLLNSLRVIHSKNIWYGNIDLDSVVFTGSAEVKLSFPRRLKMEVMQSTTISITDEEIRQCQSADIRLLGCLIAKLASRHHAWVENKKDPMEISSASFKRHQSEFVEYCFQEHTTLEQLLQHSFVTFDKETEVCAQKSLSKILQNAKTVREFGRI
uniref:Protein kinase domain-containing protein n=1 Tax=Spongospora subterranea TaxID=70186 RepID=A0A0H5RMH7_9EUKA|eukprot:CRZ09924.1 hypothetical protein [Spongospora subterranea]